LLLSKKMNVIQFQFLVGYIFRIFSLKVFAHVSN
jgi:hypothetical protein